MQIVIKAIGKLSPPLQSLLINYQKRLKIIKLTILEKSNDNQDFLFTNSASDFIIALTETGDNINSLKFSQLLFSIKNKGYNRVVFIIGGASGYSLTNLHKCQMVLSFGKLTFPHELFRVLLVEQIYRAETIYLNHPYHK